MKYAVIKLGGHQYLLKEGQEIEVEKLPQKVGETFETSDVLLIFTDNGGGEAVGMPLVAGTRVTILKKSEYRDKKVMVVKFKRKVRYHKRQGHRQWKNLIRVEKIIG